MQLFRGRGITLNFITRTHWVGGGWVEGGKIFLPPPLGEIKLLRADREVGEKEGKKNCTLATKREHTHKKIKGGVKKKRKKGGGGYVGRAPRAPSICFVLPPTLFAHFLIKCDHRTIYVLFEKQFIIIFIV
jgi:hypothetical protein